MRNNAHNDDHHYDPNRACTPSRSQEQQQQQQQQQQQLCYAGASSQPVAQQSVFRRQIETMLTRWQQLQQQNTRCLQREQSTLDDFDRIMEEDLESQLKELEREEEKQYALLVQSLEQQLKQDDSTESTQELERSYLEQIRYTELLKQFEINEQRKQYDRLLKALESCNGQEAKLDTSKLPEKTKTPWYKFNPIQTRRYQDDQRLLLAKKQKHMLQMQLQLLKANQIKTKLIIDLIESNWKTKKFYAPKRRSYGKDH